MKATEFSTGLGLAAAIVVAAGCMSPALSFDIKTAQKDGSTPVDAFRAGTKFYYSGKKGEAISAFSFAAEQGHAVSQFMLGRMYARGEGVGKNDLKAFEYYRRVARQSDQSFAPGSKRARFVAKAYVAIGAYYMTGIRDSKIEPNVERARSIFRYAASYFGDPDAQFELARMYWEGRGLEPDPKMATRWFLSSAKKGHRHAQALLGQALFYGEKKIQRRAAYGLMWLSIARKSARGDDDDWILDAQERAFALATEKQRRQAMKWVQEHPYAIN